MRLKLFAQASGLDPGGDMTCDIRMRNPDGRASAWIASSGRSWRRGRLCLSKRESLKEPLPISG